VFDLYSLLWEEKVGKRVREIDRADEARADTLSDQYQKSRRLLERQEE